jgi:hypothetical protein
VQRRDILQFKKALSLLQCYTKHVCVHEELKKKHRHQSTSATASDGDKALHRATRGRPAGELSRFLSTSVVSVAVGRS